MGSPGILATQIRNPRLRSSLLGGRDLVLSSTLGLSPLQSLLVQGRAGGKKAGGDIAASLCWAACPKDSMSHRLLARTLAHTPTISVWLAVSAVPALCRCSALSTGSSGRRALGEHPHCSPRPPLSRRQPRPLPAASWKCWLLLEKTHLIHQPAFLFPLCLSRDLSIQFKQLQFEKHTQVVEKETVNRELRLWPLACAGSGDRYTTYRRARDPGHWWEL